MKNENLHFRLSPDTVVVLEALASQRGYSPAAMLEQLVRQEALNRSVINADHPEAALLSLYNTIEGWTTDDPDFTLMVFKRIESTEEVRELYDRATIPLPGQLADRRKWHVHQSIGRFCKRLIGWESDEEIQLGKGESGLIKSYTRLKRPPARLTAEGKPSETAEKLDAAKQTIENLDLVISEVTLVRSGR
jgi:hypothetical protein